MSTSTIVVLAIVVVGLCAIPFTTHGLHVLFKDFMEYTKHKEDKKQEEKVEKVEDELKDVLENGDLSKLIDVTNQLGKEKTK